ncbi:GntR family transcriptional regulator [Veronia nyctiphanis]|uniref:GntR family transcriptional regulator n=1 Tax=Veronia nyctiphanis TaxID=1278244 RepID=A0A4Q0YRB8_9GAMM|nr:GntR family transcriptional regulator [Veronia nyctiphanis]RXJ73727.1 GntR family transcriptional regulator [Veronia nyctiphanis]
MDDKIAGKEAEPVAREPTKSDNLTEMLIEAIISGELLSGSKISEPELSRRYKVSRGPLREAMMRIETLGLIERSPHIGARVITLSETQLKEIYSVREALEVMAVRQACQHITSEELHSLKKLLTTHQQHIVDAKGASYFLQSGDFDFHYCVIKASRNQKLVSLLCDELYHLIRMYRTQFSRLRSSPKSALKEHFQIFDALCERDEDLAEMLMRRHIRRSQHLAQEFLVKNKECH